ncbi:MAG: hypothetical protein H6657_20190 [Ardenticatenaceae bacterium]|nr:hypothetical protein [Ardenticatenaceae bacterium]
MINKISILRDKMNNHLSSNDLRSLCFDLNVDYENLSGDTKKQRIESLIKLSERSDLFNSLIQHCKKKFPKLDWELHDKQKSNSSNIFSPFHNLPHLNYAKFIGRKEEFKWICDRLSSNSPIGQITLTGIGGVGKSTLALHVGYYFLNQYQNLPKTDRFDAIVWISAKELVLTTSGQEEANLPENILHTLEDVYSSIGQTLGREDITRSKPSKQGSLVMRVLRHQRILIIIDNFESITDKRIIPFLRQLPLPSKALITSRQWPDFTGTKLLAGFTWEESEKFLDAEAALNQINLNPIQKKRIFELTSGLPLPLKLSVARFSYGESYRAVERWLNDATGDLPEYCLKGQIEIASKLTNNSQKLLIVCSLFDRNAGTSGKALEEIMQLTPNEFDLETSILLKLNLLSLIEGEGNQRFRVLPIVQRYSQQNLQQTSDWEKIITRWISWLMKFARANNAHLRTSHVQRRLFKQEYPNLFVAINWCYEQKKWELLLKLCENTWNYAYQCSLFNDLEYILGLYTESAINLNDANSKATTDLIKARLFWLRDKNSEKSLEYLERAEKQIADGELFSDLAEAWSTFSQIYEEKGQIEKAVSYTLKTISLGNKTNNPTIILSGMRRLTIVYINNGQFEKAAKIIKSAEQIIRDNREMHDPGSMEAERYLAHLIDFIYFRAKILFLKKNFLEAKLLLEKIEDIAQGDGNDRKSVYRKHRMVEILLNLKEFPEARSLGLNVIQMYEKFGISGRKRQLQELLNSKLPNQGL